MYGRVSFHYFFADRRRRSHFRGANGAVPERDFLDAAIQIPAGMGPFAPSSCTFAVFGNSAPRNTVLSPIEKTLVLFGLPPPLSLAAGLPSQYNARACVRVSSV